MPLDTLETYGIGNMTNDTKCWAASLGDCDEQKQNAIAVVDKNNKFVGVITQEEMVF